MLHIAFKNQHWNNTFGRKRNGATTQNEIAWPSFTRSFNKIPTSRQTSIIKLPYSFWCTNRRRIRDRGQLKDYCFCESNYEDYKHVRLCPGTGATIKRNESRESPKLEQAKFNIQHDQCKAI
jgi:hypothetical protein